MFGIRERKRKENMKLDQRTPKSAPCKTGFMQPAADHEWEVWAAQLIHVSVFFSIS